MLDVTLLASLFVVLGTIFYFLFVKKKPQNESESISSELRSSIKSRSDYNINYYDTSKLAEYSKKCGINQLVSLNKSTSRVITFPINIVYCTDLDNTLIGTSAIANERLTKFNDFWCQNYAKNNCLLIYATGRSFKKYQLAVEQFPNLMKPDLLITADGITIHYFNKQLANIVQMKSSHAINQEYNDALSDEEFIWYDETWEALLNDHWDQAFAYTIYAEVKEKFDIVPCPPGSQYVEQWRLATLVDNEKDAIAIKQYFEKRAKEYNNDENNVKHIELHTFHCVEVHYKHNGKKCWWSSMTPHISGKGNALEHLLFKLNNHDYKQLICSGDSGNDISLLSMKGAQSIIVSNASNELVEYYNKHKDSTKDQNEYYLASKDRVDGVIEGLTHFTRSI